MSIYKFLYQDIRKVKNENLHVTNSLRNKFYDAGYINFYEIITTPANRLKKDVQITNAQFKELDRSLRRLNLSLDISQEILDWVISYYYNQYYYKLLPILQQKQKKNITSKPSNKHFKSIITNFNKES
jgi:hypothetical protein